MAYNRKYAIKNEAFEFDIPGMISQATPSEFVDDPTIDAGDARIVGDDTLNAALTNLPAVAPAGTPNVRVRLEAAEMNYSVVKVYLKSVSNQEWNSHIVVIRTVEDVYTAIARYVRDGTTDRLEVRWYELLAQVTSGIQTPPNPQIALEKPDGTVWQAATDLTQGANGTLYKDLSNVIPQSQVAIAICTAKIDDVTRTFRAEVIRA